jgi:hypothetical protein
VKVRDHGGHGGRGGGGSNGPRRRALVEAPDSEPCKCGRVRLDWFTGTHSQLTKEGAQFISTNHRRDRCDREVVPVDEPRCANGHVLGRGPHFCDECDATCSCACANHPSGGCGCPCLRHPREGT